MARTYREIAIQEMLLTVEEAMSSVLDNWGDLPPEMKEAVEQFRVQLGVAIDSVEFVRKALAREVRERGRVEDALARLEAKIGEAIDADSILVGIFLTDRVQADNARLAQLLSNLLSNALAHGKQGGIVKVSATTAKGNFELWVSNPGEPIPAETLTKPHKRNGQGSVPQKAKPVAGWNAVSRS